MEKHHYFKTTTIKNKYEGERLEVISQETGLDLLMSSSCSAHFALEADSRSPCFL